jgi:hypothetical protein
MWPDCSPPRLKPCSRIRLAHVAVADIGAVQVQAARLEEAFEAHVGHDGGHHADRRRRRAAGCQLPATSARIWSPSITGPLVVDQHRGGSGVAIERDAEIGAGA